MPESVARLGHPHRDAVSKPVHAFPNFRFARQPDRADSGKFVLESVSRISTFIPYRASSVRPASGADEVYSVPMAD